jgi:hypothetical protein
MFTLPSFIGPLRAEGVGQGPMRTGFEQAIWAMTKVPNCWKMIGRWYVPDLSPVCDWKKWFVFGTLLATALLAVGTVYPISLVIIHILLWHLWSSGDPYAIMDLSLQSIKEIDEERAKVALPWMIIPPGQDWRQLPHNHRVQLLYMISGLEIDVSLRPHSPREGTRSATLSFRPQRFPLSPKKNMFDGRLQSMPVSSWVVRHSSIPQNLWNSLEASRNA